MRKLMVILVFALAGCGPSIAPVGESGTVEVIRLTGGVTYIHDVSHKVGCWLVYGNAISCLPDSVYSP